MPPITLVQSRSIAGVGLAFAAGVTKGDLLVVVAGSQDIAGAITFACSDTQTNAYSSTALVDANPIGGGRAQLFYALAKANGVCIVNIVTGSATPQLAIHQFSGVDAFDISGSATGTGNAQDSGAVSVGSINNLLFGFSLLVPVGLLTFTPGAGWTQAQLLGSALLTEYQVVGAIGNYDATTNTTVGKGGSVRWATELAAWSAVPKVRYYVGCRQRISRVWPGMNNYR